MNVCHTHDLSYKLRAREFQSILVTFKGSIYLFQAFLVAQMVKYLPTMQVQSLSWESCLENPTDRVAWQATVHGAAKSQMPLGD